MGRLPFLPFFALTLLFIFKLFSQHRIGTRTDSVVLIMVRNKGFNPLVTVSEWRKTRYISPIPLLWTSFRLISMGMAKNEICKKKRRIFRLT